MKKNNYERLLELSIGRIASALWNYLSDTCAYCPRGRERRCNEDCRAGLRDWLYDVYIPSSDVWKEKKRK